MYSPLKTVLVLGGFSLTVAGITSYQKEQEFDKMHSEFIEKLSKPYVEDYREGKISFDEALGGLERIFDAECLRQTEIGQVFGPLNLNKINEYKRALLIGNDKQAFGDVSYNYDFTNGNKEKVIMYGKNVVILKSCKRFEE